VHTVADPLASPERAKVFHGWERAYRMSTASV
jgi:hypothetical protein